MITRIFIARTTNGASGTFQSTGRFATLLTAGTFGGAAVAVEVSPDGGTTWITTTLSVTGPSSTNFIAGNGLLYRLTVSGATGTTNLNAWVAYES